MTVSIFIAHLIISPSQTTPSPSSKSLFFSFAPFSHLCPFVASVITMLSHSTFGTKRPIVASMAEAVPPVIISGPITIHTDHSSPFDDASPLIRTIKDDMEPASR